MTEQDTGGPTQHGFDWGPMRVVRMALIGRNTKGTRILGVKTFHHDLQISVSPTGRSVRVWRDGKELT